MARLVVVMILSLSIAANAGDASIQDRIYSIWSRVKTKVTSIWTRWSGSNPSEPAKQQQEPERSVANVSPQGGTPVAQPPSSAPAPQAQPVVRAEPVDRAPHFVAPLKGSSKQEMQSVAQTVKGQPIFRVSKPARAASVQIPLDRAGVPVLALEKEVTSKVKKGKKVVTKTETVRVVNKIPSLDIGEEAKVDSQEFTLPQIEILRVDYKKYGELKSPELWSKKENEKSLGAPLVLAKDPTPVKSLINTEGIGVVTLKKVQDVAYKIAEDSALDLKAVKDMDEEDLRFIRGLMLYVSGDKCHFAAGIFHASVSSKKESIRNASRYYLGECLHKMGLMSQAADNLVTVLGSQVPEELKSRALAILTDFPEEYNVELGQKLEKYMGENYAVKPEQKNKANYMVAAAAMRRESFATARRFAEQVSDSSPLYIRSQLIVALSDYNMGKAKTGLDRLKRMQNLLPKDPVHRDLHALISLNLARMAFQEKQHAEAGKYYLAIEKNHPLWITGLTEHAWNQLMSGDNEGAIGNMFSLQSTYLKAVYRPESYIVRTIGYLNLCQYADAYKSLSMLEREYRPWLPRIDNYMQNNPKPVSYYNTMIKYLTSSSATEVGGLPYQALREIGRHKDFLNIQESINLKIDEADQFKIIDSVAVKDFERTKGLRNQAAARLRAIEAELKLIAKGKKLPADENQLKMKRTNERNTIEFYDFQMGVFKEASASYKKLKESGRQFLVSEREKLATRAGEILKKRLAQIKTDLLKYFENNEFLRYEVFAGSGENIRFHMAAGESGGEKRLPSTVKPESKGLNWEFEGEFWEDEIGHYKSTLKDNCPQRAASTK